MHPGFLNLHARRILHARALATGAEANRSRTSDARSEARLLETCDAFNQLEQRKIRLLQAGDDERPGFDLALARLGMEQADQLSGMCNQRAVTIHGHRARAISFALWDGGDLAYRARASAALEDMILHSIVRDLSSGRGRR